MSRAKSAGGYYFILDYHPEYRWRRWQVRSICVFDDARSDTWRCFFLSGARRLRERLHARAEHASRLLVCERDPESTGSPTTAAVTH